MKQIVKVGTEITCCVESDGKGDALVVSLERWQNEREQLLLTEAELGVRLSVDADIALLVAELQTWSLIEIEFEDFTDGRGFSLASQLRQLGYRGELRAVGVIIIDQFSYLQRCGFDAFQLPEGATLTLAKEVLTAFSDSYQVSC